LTLLYIYLICIIGFLVNCDNSDYMAKVYSD